MNMHWTRIGCRRVSGFLGGLLALSATMTTALAGESIKVGTVERTFEITAPAATQGRKVALVLVLHGGGGNGRRMRGWAGIDPIAEREGFIAIYPDGLDKGWADGRGDFNRSRSGGQPPDDVAFLKALVDAQVSAGRVDPARVYVVGASNGGMMALRLACSTKGVFAGYAALIASLPRDIEATCNPADPVRLLLMNGTADPLVPFEGGNVGFFGRRGAVLSTPATFALWQKAGGCAGVSPIERVPDRDRSDSSTVEITRATDCKPGAAVTLYTIRGGGHQLPGKATKALPLMGAANRDIEAAEVVWSFLSGPPS